MKTPSRYFPILISPCNVPITKQQQQQQQQSLLFTPFESDSETGGSLEHREI